MKKTKKTLLTAAAFAAALSLSACDGTSSSGSSSASLPSSDYEPSTEEIYDVYGPPSDIEPDTDIQCEYGPPAIEDDTTPPTEDGIMTDDIQCVYGPPPDID